MSASYLHGAFQEPSIYLAVKWALGFVRQKHFCILLIPCKGRESHKRGACSECFVPEPGKQGSDEHGPSPAQSQVTAGLVSIWVFHEFHAQGQTFSCGFFSSSLPICLLLLLWQWHNTLSWGRRGPQPCLTLSRCQGRDEEHSERSPCLKGLGKTRTWMALYCPTLLLRPWDMRNTQRPRDSTGDCPLDPKPSI